MRGLGENSHARNLQGKVIGLAYTDFFYHLLYLGDMKRKRPALRLQHELKSKRANLINKHVIDIDRCFGIVPPSDKARYEAQQTLRHVLSPVEVEKL